MLSVSADLCNKEPCFLNRKENISNDKKPKEKKKEKKDEKRKCEKCGEMNDKSDMFCANCGAKKKIKMRKKDEVSNSKS